MTEEVDRDAVYREIIRDLTLAKNGIEKRWGRLAYTMEVVAEARMGRCLTVGESKKILDRLVRAEPLRYIDAEVIFNELLSEFDGPREDS